MYFERHAASGVNRVISQFPVVLITGARQVGKTTLLRKTYPDAQYFSLDDYILLESAKSDSLGFIKNCRPPVIIDEIQYAPEILRAIKIAADESTEEACLRYGRIKNAAGTTIIRHTSRHTSSAT